MPNRPFYTCTCLNVKIYISEKDAAESPEDRQWEKLDGLEEEGWPCRLGADGIVTKFNNLTSTEETGRWEIISCHNCSTSAVYSINLDASLASSNAIVIHRGALFVESLEEAKKDEYYSTTFGIKIKENATMQYADQSPVPEELASERRQLVQLLDQSLDKMQLESQLRLEQLEEEMQKLEMQKEEEKTRLKQSIAKANAESSILWQKIVVVEKSKTEAERRRKTKVVREKLKEQAQDKQPQHVRFAEADQNEVNSPAESARSEDEEEDMFDMDEKESSTQKYIRGKMDEDGSDGEDEGTERSIPPSNATVSMAASVPINILRPVAPNAPKLQLDTLPLGQSLDTRHRFSLPRLDDEAGF